MTVLTDPAWTSEAPLEEGLFWFYGVVCESAIKGTEPKLRLVDVYRIGPKNPPGPPKQWWKYYTAMTIRAAILRVLKDHPKGLSIAEIADYVNRHATLRKTDARQATVDALHSLRSGKLVRSARRGARRGVYTLVEPPAENPDADHDSPRPTDRVA